MNASFRPRRPCTRLLYLGTAGAQLTTVAFRIMGWTRIRKHLQMRGFPETLLQVPWIPVPPCFLKIPNHIPKLKRHRHQGTTAWDRRSVAASQSHPARGSACCPAGKRSCSRWPERNSWTGPRRAPRRRACGWLRSCLACRTASRTASLTASCTASRMASRTAACAIPTWAPEEKRRPFSGSCDTARHTHCVHSVSCSETGVFTGTAYWRGHCRGQQKAVAPLRVLGGSRGGLPWYFCFCACVCVCV